MHALREQYPLKIGRIRHRIRAESDRPCHKSQSDPCRQLLGVLIEEEPLGVAPECGFPRGRILLGGVDLAECGLKLVRRTITIVPQELHIFVEGGLLCWMSVRSRRVELRPNVRSNRGVCVCVCANMSLGAYVLVTYIADLCRPFVALHRFAQ